jgi:transcriptional regulator
VESKLLSGTVEMLILEVLAPGPNYGYQIVQTVAARSDGSLELKEGSLYPALHRLERQKFLSSYWDEFEGRRRKYYKLTASGRRILAAKRDEWLQFASGVNGVLGVQYGMA